MVSRGRSNLTKSQPEMKTKFHGMQNPPWRGTASSDDIFRGKGEKEEQKE